MAEINKPVPDDVRMDDEVRRLRECLSYNPNTGVLRWKIQPTSNVAIGDVAGCLGHHGYRMIRVDRKLLLGHRIAWAMYYGAWPERNIDHKNRDKSDNRIANLRLATRGLNVANSPARNKNGLPKGCYWHKGRERWYSQIVVDGKVRRLGIFDTAEEAAKAFKREHSAAHGDFSCCEMR